MTVRLNFNFDGYSDFDEFVEKHEDVINEMAEGDRSLTEQMRNSVRVNKKLPEHFTFTQQQLNAMYQRDREGMQKLIKDGRVTVKRESD